MTAPQLVRASTLPQTDRHVARRGLEAEYAALLTMVDGFDSADWRRPTDCTEWTVRDMVSHLAGAAEAAARVPTLIRQCAVTFRGAATGDRDLVDYLCMFQIAQRSGLTDSHLAADLARWAPEAPAGGERIPRLLRRIPLPPFAGARPGALFDVIPSRDVWLHRVDLHRATGGVMPETSHEREVVDQVVRDLDHEWTGPALDLHLTGRGGGSWRIGAGEPVAVVTEDAVTYLRLLSGRSDECRLDTDGQPHAAHALRTARVLF